MTNDSEITSNELSKKTLPPVVDRKSPGRSVDVPEYNVRFQEFLEKYGLDKAKWLDMADETSKAFTDNLFKRAKALEVLKRESEAVLDLWNSTGARGLTVYEDLVKLSIDIQARLNKQRSIDPEYDPLEDKILQAALRRKQDMIIQLDKMKIDVRRLINDEKNKREGKEPDKVIDATTATMEDFQLDDVKLD